MDFKSLVIDILDKCIIEIKEENNMKKIKETILNPFTTYIIEQVYPYLVISVIIFSLTLLIAIIILILLIRGHV